VDLAGLSFAMLAGAAIVLVAVVGVRVSARIGLPSLLLYLGLGLLLGGLFPQIRLGDAELATVLGYAALVVILAEGGLTTRVQDLRPVLWPALALATLGVAVSIAVVAAALVLLLGVDVRLAVLIGAVLAATDAAAVFSVLRHMRLHPRLRSLLEAEAGFNDAPVVVLVVVLSTGDVSADNAWQVPLIVLGELVGGAVVGGATAWAARWTLPRLALPAAGLYPIAVLSILAGAYGLAGVLHTSGFMAVYVAGVLIGSARSLPHRRSVVGFAEGLAWVAQIGLFVMLGLLADPVRAIDSIGTALVAGVVLLLVARPLSALVALVPFRMPARWIAFVSVAGLRGAVPIVFAAIPLGADVPGAAAVFDTTLILVVLLTLLQTSVLPWSTRRLGVEVGGTSDELEVESAPLDNMNAALLGVDIEPESRLKGLYLVDLRLPPGAAVALVVRGDSGFVPDANTRFRSGDTLLIVATEAVRPDTVRRLRLVAREGRLARWRRSGHPQQPPRGG
jgi:cell volume regulation protein A